MQAKNLSLIIIALFVFISFENTRALSYNPENKDNGIFATELKCEYRIDPLGIDVELPRFSWILLSSQRAQKQSAYRILVSEDKTMLVKNRGNIWDSGKIYSNETIHIVYDGIPLKSRTKYFWKVRVWDKNGTVSDWSNTACWEMALLREEKWAALWINDGKSNPEKDEDFYKNDPAPLFRKEFRIEKKVKKARLYISGLGYYEAFLNGKRIGDLMLDPGWTNYSETVLYSTYDVTEMITNNKNCLGVIVGNGWYNPLPLRMWGNRNLREDLPIGRPRFIAQLYLDFENGGSQLIVSDSSWKVHDGPLVRNNIYLGEVYDAGKEIPGWDLPGFGDDNWDNAAPASEPVGQLGTQNQPPIQKTADLKPVKISEPKPGLFIFDFGQNFAGWVTLKVRATAGKKIKLRYGELLYDDGTLNPMTSVCGQIKGLRNNGTPVGGPGAPEIAYQADTYITSGEGLEIYTPKFTFHAFRYVEIAGYPGTPELSSLTGSRLNSNVEEVGSFSCSNDMLNRIQEMTKWTFLSNIFSLQSDCPHREKFGYGGDIAVSCDAFILNFDMATFYGKTVYDWHDAALPDGMLTDTAPFVGIQYCGVGWAMVHPLLLSRLYQYYGDRRILEQQYNTSKRWFDLVSSQNKNYIIESGLSDHESLTDTPSPPLVTPLYYRSAELLSRLAELLDREDDAKKYEILSNKIKTAYIDKFFNPDSGKIFPGTQTSQSFALYLDLVPPEKKKAAIQFLLDDILNKNSGHLTTGIFGTKFLLQLLSQQGYNNIAYDIVNQKTFPGWGNMLENGATTLWEHWDFSDNTYSHNHPMFGSVSQWFFNWLGGIQPHPESKGFDLFIIRPQIIDDLNRVNCSYKSIRGLITSNWHQNSNRLYLDIEVPVNSSALVYLPTDSEKNIRESEKQISDAVGVTFLEKTEGALIYTIGSGKYSFEIYK